MIIDKLKSAAKFAILFVIALLIMTSCSKKSDDLYNHVFTDDEGHNHTHGVVLYRVVIPDDASATVLEKAEALAANIKSKTETESRVFREYELEKMEKNSGYRDILVGNLSSDVARNVLKNYKYNDYGYCFSNGCVVIAGISESAVINAIDKFSNDVLPYSDCESIMSQSAEYFYGETYPVNSVKLAGYDLNEYYIVVPRSDESARSAAVEFSRRVASATGYYLPVCSEADTRTAPRVISIGDTLMSVGISVNCVENEFSVRAYNGGVLVSHGGEISLNAALERLCEMFTVTSTDGNVSVPLSLPIREMISYSAPKIVTLNAKKRSLGVTQIIELCAYLKGESPDIIRLCGYDAESVTYVSENMGSQYGLVVLRDSELCHIYKKGSFSSVSASVDEMNGFSVFSVSYTFTNSDDLTICEIKTNDPNAVAIAENASQYVKDKLEGGNAIAFGHSFSGDAESAFVSKINSNDRILNLFKLDLYATGDVCTEKNCSFWQKDHTNAISATVCVYKI